MKIGKYEYNMMLTVGAADTIAKMCPGGELARMDELLKTNAIEAVAELIVAMANGADDFAELMGEELTHPRLTKKMVLSLPFQGLKDVQSEMIAQFAKDVKPSVELAPAKKNDAASD